MNSLKKPIEDRPTDRPTYEITISPYFTYVQIRAKAFVACRQAGQDQDRRGGTPEADS